MRINIISGAKVQKRNGLYVEKLTLFAIFLHTYTKNLVYLEKKSYLCTEFNKMGTLTDIRQSIANDWIRYEQSMADCLQSDNRALQEVLSYIRSRSGKQLRPLLVLLSAQICHSITEKTIYTATALEMLHNASLVHDDVVDSSDTRHGIPAVHAQWNNKVAVLTGDYMLAKVIALIAEVRNTRILEIISSLGQSLSSGEVLQLHIGQSMWIDEERYLQIINQKTAQLFQSCAEAGGESAGCTQRQRTALKEYGRLLGLCFQIKDDIFDYSDLEDLGKPTMSDLRDGKVTLPLIIALQRAPKPEADHIRQLGELVITESESPETEKRLEEIKSFVLRFQGNEYAVQKMLAYKKQAIEALRVFRDSKTKESLLALLDYAIHRIQ